MKVFWTETAVNHLASIYSYISQNSSQYAVVHGSQQIKYIEEE